MRVKLACVPALVSIALPCGGLAQGSIDFGQTVSGNLSFDDAILDDDSYYDDWRFYGAAGTVVHITLEADDFDAYLDFGRDESGYFNSLQTNDDDTEGTDSALTYTLPDDGVYVVRANSLGSRETGAYRVTLTANQAASASGRGTLLRAVPVTGALEPSDATSGSRHHEDWTFTGQSGERVTVSLTGDFDTYVHVYGHNGSEWTELGSDDDGGDGLSSMLTLNLPADGDYMVCATSASDGVTGRYTLELIGGSVQSAVGAQGGKRQSIEASRPASGTLDASDPLAGDDTHYEDWTYLGLRGERVRIIMRSSDFDAYLQLGQTSGASFSSIATQDDGAGGTDTLLEATLPSDGEFVIRANALSSSRTTGDYTLLVQGYR